MAQDEFLTFTKQGVAEHQLDTAIRLFLDDRDYVSAVTLAGASEEILGKLLELKGHKHALQEHTELCVQIGRDFLGEELPSKHFVEIANACRNGLKHFGDGEDIVISRDVAIEMLNRTIDNLSKLTHRQSPLVRRFVDEIHGI